MNSANGDCTLIIYSKTKHVLMFTDMFRRIVRSRTDFWTMRLEMQRKPKWMRQVMVEMRRMEIRSRKKKSRWLEFQNSCTLSIFSTFPVKFCSHSNKFFFQLPSIVGTPRPPFSRRLRTPVCKQISLPPSFTFRPPNNEPPYEDDQGRACI